MHDDPKSEEEGGRVGIAFLFKILFGKTLCLQFARGDSRKIPYLGLSLTLGSTIFESKIEPSAGTDMSE